MMESTSHERAGAQVEIATGEKAPRKPPSDIKQLLARWRAGADVHARGHLRMAVRYEKRHYWLGIPGTMMGAIVGTTIFGTWEKAAASWPLKMSLAAVSMTSACLVALQTFLRYLERAGQHNLAHAEYSEIAHALELLSMTEKTREEWVKALEGLSQRLDSIKGKAPLPDDIDALERDADELADRYREQMRASIKRKPPPAPALSQLPAALDGPRPGLARPIDAGRCVEGHDIPPGQGYCAFGHPIPLESMSFHGSDNYGPSVSPSFSGPPLGTQTQSAQVGMRPPPGPPLGAHESSTGSLLPTVLEWLANLRTSSPAQTSSQTAYGTPHDDAGRRSASYVEQLRSFESASSGD